MQVDQHATDEVVDQVATLPEVTVVHRGVVHDPVGGVHAIHQLYTYPGAGLSVPIHPTTLQVLSNQLHVPG